MLTGDAEGADPVCSLSPNHHVITQAIEDSRNPVSASQPIIFRNDKNSKAIIAGELNDRVKEFHALP
jgi:pyrroloquinoline quinone biosynthesis protein E